MSSGTGRKVVLSAALLCGLAGLCQAAPPEVVDRVPTSAAGVIMVRNIGDSFDRIKHIVEMFPKEGDDQGPLGEITSLLDTPGFNKNGSAAMVMLTGADGTVSADLPPDRLMIVPVSSYADFVKHFGGNGAEKVTKIEIKPGQASFARDIGGGFAALSDKQEIVEAFEGKAGQTAAHGKLLGKVGGRIADDSNVLAVGVVKALRPMIQNAIDSVKQQAEIIPLMAGGNPQAASGAAGAVSIITSVMEGFEKDGQAGVIGVNITDAGIALDVGAQFTEGSEVSKFFVAEGKSSRLIGSLPNQPFYFAGALDSGNAGLKQIMKNAAKQSADAAAAAAKANDPNAPAPTEAPSAIASLMGDLDNQTGTAIMFGQSPALLSGLFLNTSGYVEGKEPQKLLASYRDGLQKANGVRNGPVTTKVDYTKDFVKIGDTSVDKWKMALEIDPADPMSSQAKQIMTVLFGPAGPTGLTAPSKNGVVSVVGTNQQLLTSALEAANTGKGLGENEQLKAAAGHLPANRSAELYIGVGPIMESVTGFMALMGGGPNFQVPEKLSPIAIGAAMDNGGAQFRVFVPTDVVKTLGDLAKSTQEQNEPAGEAPAGGAEDKPKNPRF